MRSDPTAGAGAQLRAWRLATGQSQMAVALDCGVSTRHLSFVETGRARPSRELILHLARHLRPTSRSVNQCLLAAGYAPEWLGEADNNTGIATDVLHEMVMLHDPNPAFLFNADWRMQRLNGAGQRLCSMLMPELWAEVRDPSIGFDMIAALCHEAGLLSRLARPLEVGLTLLRQLRLEQWTNPRLEPRADMLEAFLWSTYGTSAAVDARDPADPYLRLEVDTDYGRLSFLALQVVVGIPQEITVGSIRTEVWYPADRETRRLLSDLALSLRAAADLPAAAGTLPIT